MTKIVGLVLKSKKEVSRSESEAKSMTKKKQDSPKVLALTSKGFERHRVKHDYHDYARVMELPSQLDMDMVAKASGGVNNPFPTILHKLLSETDMMGCSHLISWQTHGRSFLIHKPREFVREVVPRYFKHSKLSSFQRQLSLYGFVRLTNEGPDKGAYYHELFLRGRPFLCSKIQRTRVKGTWVRTSSSPESEPDFFSMKPVEDFDEFGPASSQLTKPPSNSTSCLGSEGQNLLGAPYPNFVTPKSSPFLRGGGKFTNSLQHSLSVEEFDLDSAMLQNEQDTHASMNTPVARTFGLHPPPSLLQIASETSATCNFDDQATRESKSPKHALPTTSTRIESTYKTETKRLDVSARSSCNQKWYSSEIPSLTRLGKALSNPEGLDEEDDELRTFLRDVDLDLGFELEMVEEILQSSVF